MLEEKNCWYRDYYCNETRFTKIDWPRGLTNLTHSTVHTAHLHMHSRPLSVSKNRSLAVPSRTGIHSTWPSSSFSALNLELPLQFSRHDSLNSAFSCRNRTNFIVALSNSRCLLCGLGLPPCVCWSKEGTSICAATVIWNAIVSPVNISQWWIRARVTSNSTRMCAVQCLKNPSANVAGFWSWAG